MTIFLYFLLSEKEKEGSILAFVYSSSFLFSISKSIDSEQYITLEIVLLEMDGDAYICISNGVELQIYKHG